MEEKVNNNYIKGLIFSTSWRIAHKKTKIPIGIWIFQNTFQN